jgi:adenylate cyclase
VNVASRLESHGVAGRIQVSERVRQALADRFAFEPRGTIDLKGKGLTTAFLLVPPACVPSPWMGEG